MSSERPVPIILHEMTSKNDQIGELSDEQFYDKYKNATIISGRFSAKVIRNNNLHWFVQFIDGSWHCYKTSQLIYPGKTK